MKKKTIRTIIISALVLFAVIITIFSIDIEPAKKTIDTPEISSSIAEVEKTEEKSVEKENETEKEKEISYDEQKVETEKEVSSDEQKSETITETPVKEQKIVTEEQEITMPEAHICTIEIRCDTVTDTSKLENPAVVPYIPSSGIILEQCEMEFSPGESVFDILLRATREKNIHLEFRDDNLYNGKYIEGINYLYELDGGPLSGWMYKVNGKFPNYGCSSYMVNDNDAIVWIYTCDLGTDVGDNSQW